VSELGRRRFLFITGKGGVGKTTVTAALARALGDAGKRVLIAMCGEHERLSSMMATPAIGHDIAKVAPNVWATRIVAERAMQEYGEIVIKVKAIARAVFDNKYTNAFFRAVPGLHEWAMLGKAWFHTTERDGDDWRFDVVLFDAPSTGHGLDMLRVPKVILDIVPPGVLRRDAEAAWSLFRDPERSGVVVVSLPEDMPATETLELVGALNDELELPVAQLIVNAKLDVLFSSEERAMLLAGVDIDVSAPADEAVPVQAIAAAARRASREEIQERNTRRLAAKLGIEPVVIPFLLEGAGDPEAIAALAGVLAR